jgi:tRNA (cytidine/uridine-2'-O-)-methyltransferase
MHLHVLLHRPEIPPNTGNIIRLCANTGAHLHLIEPLGFALDDARLRRAGLDYHEFAALQCHRSLDQCLQAIAPTRLFAFSTRGSDRHDHIRYQPGDALLFGSESAGLPAEVWQTLPAQHSVRIPMRPQQRSLNLSNAVAVAVFEVWRQWKFVGAAD